ncbi:MAG: response regulator transcription factor [Candidatus Dormibacteria bacterium]
MSTMEHDEAEGRNGHPRKRVLVAEDDDAVRSVIRDCLHSDNYDVDEVADGQAALDAARSSPPDVLILDWGLPEVTGADVCRELRREGHGFPIIMLTARSSTIDLVVGLEVGADDYVTKPFDVRELVARVGAQVRASGRQRVPAQRSFTAGRLSLDPAQRRAFVDDSELQLTYTEFNLLSYLLSNQNTALSRQQLLDKVWGYRAMIETKTVDAHVQRLRKKLQAAGDVGVSLEPVPGVGYRLSAG